ncbi:hypothetical protein PMAYCL1PPCAC_14023, partial [Pristionchus mayeri]
NNFNFQHWDTFSAAVNQCATVLPLRKPQPFFNKDEIKYAYLSSREEVSILLTIGVGNDTVAEEQFRKEQPKTKFYGADPISDPNDGTYSKMGEFFPFAIGRDTKKSIASVLVEGRYVDRPMFHLNIIVFLKYIIKQKHIDHMWLDAEEQNSEFTTCSIEKVTSKRR